MTIELRSIMRWLYLVAIVGCNKSPSEISDATPLDTAVVDVALDGAIAHTGLPATMFSINWPSHPVIDPPSNNPWPTTVGADYGSLRTWGSIVDWAGIEPALIDGVRCDPKILGACWVWNQLDAMLADTHQLGADTLHFVTADYPAWSNGGGSSAVLPTDVADTTTVCAAIPEGFRTAAGLGAGDCQFQEFVFALAMHACASCDAAAGSWQGALAIRSFSPGNEVNGKGFVMPPCAANAAAPCDAIARMASDLYKIIKYVDATATVGTPSFTQLDGDQAMAYYLTRASAYGDIADVEIFHIYGQTGEIGAGIPELSWSARIARYAALTAKPMWVDEGGWGQNFQTNSAGQACTAATSDCGCLATPKAACMDANNASANETIDSVVTAPAPGYLVRGYLLMIAGGVDRFYWFGPGSDEWGSFADCVGGGTCTNQPTAAAFAWHAMYQWLLGATMGTLAQSDTQYTYPITAKDPTRPTGCSAALAAPGYHALIAWDTMAAPQLSCAGYTQYCTLFEAASGLAGGAPHPCTDSVTLGPNPILLE